MRNRRLSSRAPRLCTPRQPAPHSAFGRCARGDGAAAAGAAAPRRVATLPAPPSTGRPGAAGGPPGASPQRWGRGRRRAGGRGHTRGRPSRRKGVFFCCFLPRMPAAGDDAVTAALGRAAPHPDPPRANPFRSTVTHADGPSRGATSTAAPRHASLPSPLVTGAVGRGHGGCDRLVCCLRRPCGHRRCCGRHRHRRRCVVPVQTAARRAGTGSCSASPPTLLRPMLPSFDTPLRPAGATDAAAAATAPATTAAAAAAAAHLDGRRRADRGRRRDVARAPMQGAQLSGHRRAMQTTPPLPGLGTAWLRWRQPSQAALCACVPCMGRVAPLCGCHLGSPTSPAGTQLSPDVTARRRPGHATVTHRGGPTTSEDGGNSSPSPGRRAPPGAPARMLHLDSDASAPVGVAHGGIRPIPDLGEVAAVRGQYSELAHGEPLYSRVAAVAVCRDVPIDTRHRAAQFHHGMVTTPRGGSARAPSTPVDS